MSCYFQIFASKKGEERDINHALMLFSLSTTPARELDQDVGFVFDKFTGVDSRLLSQIREAYSDKLKSYQQQLEECKEEEARLIGFAQGCSSSEATSEFLSRANEERERIMDLTEEIDGIQHHFTKIAFVSAILEDANYGEGDWDFWYCYG